MHLKNVFSAGELVEAAIGKDFLQAQKEGNRPFFSLRITQMCDRLPDIKGDAQRDPRNLLSSWFSSVLNETLKQRG